VDTASTELHTEELHIGTPQPLIDIAQSPTEPEVALHEHHVGQMMDSDMEPPMAEEEPDQDAERPQQATVEDIANEDGEDEWVHQFPEGSKAGASRERSRTLFEVIRDDQVLRGAEVLGPFESDDEWQLAKWLIKNVGHNQAEHFLKLPIVGLYSVHPLSCNLPPP
jgi:hypothetical protein